MAADDKVIIGLTHGLDDPEGVLISYLMGVEALRKAKQVLLWLSKDGVHVGTEGLCCTNRRAGRIPRSPIYTMSTSSPAAASTPALCV